MIQDDYFNKEDTPTDAGTKVNLIMCAIYLAVGAAIAGSVMCLATLLFT